MYRIIRDLHLYLGLFVSPFVLLFAASVFFLNHGKVIPGSASSGHTCQPRSIPSDIADVQGTEAVNRVRQVLDVCGVTGEIGFVRNQRKEQRIVVPVSAPGRETTVTIDLVARSASVSERQMSIWETIAYLHKSPGPHNVAIRGNWFWTRAWRWPADATIYLLLFISASGVYLWLAIRAERRIGIVLLAAGALSFFGTIYAILR
jgi:hypothetical protein